MPAYLPESSDTGSEDGKLAAGSRKAGGSGGCPLDLSGALRFPWLSPLGFSLARCCTFSISGTSPDHFRHAKIKLVR